MVEVEVVVVVVGSRRRCCSSRRSRSQVVEIVDIRTFLYVVYIHVRC